MRPGRKAPLPPDAKLPALRARGSARVVEFCRRHLVHVKGQLKDQPLALAAWQKRDIIGPLFDTLGADGRRQYRTCYVEIPRKNAKSTLASALALYLLLYDHEPGADIVSAAADRQQAAITFDIARQMVESNPVLADYCQLYRREIVVPSTGSTYRVISSEAYSKHGLNLHAAIVDELHAHESDELLNVLVTSMGGRRQPLTFIITTAGHRHSVCWDYHERAQLIREGQVEEPTFLPVLYGASAQDDWRDPRVWARANPGLGTTIYREEFERMCREAEQRPRFEAAFRQLHLNVWDQDVVRWLSMDAWDRGAAAPADLRGRRCFVGVDLSSNKDLSAWVALFPDEAGGFDVRCRFYTPEDQLEVRARRDGVPYDVWARTGQLVIMPGTIVNHDVIEQDLRDLAEREGYRVEAIAVDPWNAAQMIARMQGDGLPAIPVPQTMARLSSATKRLEELVLTARLRHGGQPVLRWCAANVTIEQDVHENIRPSKARSTGRIDGITALVNALSRALIAPPAPGPHAYEAIIV